MANYIQVMGDSNTKNANVETPPQTFYHAAGKLVCVNGTPLTDQSQTANGSSFFKINGIPVNFFGNEDTDGGTRDGTDVNWFIIQS